MSKLLTYLLILFVTVLGYGSSLHYGFSQDDWYFLLISQASNLSDVINFFNPLTQSGFAFFRPLGTQLYYFLFQGNPFLMHVFMLFTQSFSGYLVYLLLRELKLKSPTPILVALAYSVSSVHFLSLYYIAATQQLLAAAFSLLSLIFFLKKKYLPSALVLVLALLSKETAIVTPLIALVLIFLTKVKLTIRSFIPFITVLTIYLSLRLATSSGTQSEYHLFLGPSVLTNLRWYFLFAANFPEALVNYGLPRMGINITRFISDHGNSALIITIGSSLIATLALTRLFLSKRLSYAIWFVVGLGPVIFLRNHLYPHYLDLALIPFLLLLLQDLKVKHQYIIAAFFIATSLLSIRLSQTHHWTTGRAEIATAALAFYDWDGACKQSNIVFIGEGSTPRELSYALSLANGPRVICKRDDLGVYYQGVDQTYPADAYPIKVKK